MKRLVTILLLLCCASANARRHYVDINATGLNNGTSWEDAWTELSVPLDNGSYAGDTFWVADGTYTSHTSEPWAFHLLTNTVLYGGFNGTETLLSQRNFSGFNTVLAGDNLRTGAVVSFAGGGRLDGFKITHGAHAAIQATSYGVQVYNGVMANCLLTNLHGLGAAVTTGNAEIIGCQFINNGLAPTSNPVRGSAVRCTSSSVVRITDCLFRNNQGTHGGAINLTTSSQLTVNRSLFYGNSATVGGGAIYNDAAAKLRVFNSLLVGNKAPLGGAHYTPDTLNQMHNFSHCTIAHNWSSTPSAQNYALWLRGANDTLRNCIIWGDSTGTGPEIANPKSGTVFNRNIIEGGASIFGASSTYTFDPSFASGGTAASAPFPAASAYDYHLSRYSDAIDTGANLALAAPFNVDRDGNPRAQGRFPDLGAYEWKACPWLNVAVNASGPTTFCLPGSVTLTASANPLYNHIYQWNGGSQTGAAITVNTSGVNKVVVVDSLGCRSSASVTVNAIPVPAPVITYGAGNTLSVPGTYATYQWFLAGNPISGANGATHQPTTNGTYTVRVTTTLGGCAGISPAYSLNNLAVGHNALEAALNIYPNPGDGHFVLSFAAGSIARVTVTVRNVTGQEILRQHFDQPGNPFSKALHVTGAPGVYFVEVCADENRMLRRLIIE